MLHGGGKTLDGQKTLQENYKNLSEILKNIAIIEEGNVFKRVQSVKGLAVEGKVCYKGEK